MVFLNVVYFDSCFGVTVCMWYLWVLIFYFSYITRPDYDVRLALSGITPFSFLFLFLLLYFPPALFLVFSFLVDPCFLGF